MDDARVHTLNQLAYTSNHIRRIGLLGAAVCILLLLAACSEKQGSGQHATIQMRDGSTLTGTVTATSPSEITLTGDDSKTHQIPMTQVKSIEYDEPQAAQNSSNQPNATPSQPSSGRTSGLRERHHPSQAEIRSKTYVVPENTKLSVRADEAINSATAAEGQTYAADVTDDVLDANGDVVIPHGSNARIVIRSASKGGRIRGASDLVLDLQSVSVEGQEYLVSTTDLQQSGKQGLGANRRTAEYAGGAAAVGAIIGAIAGGGKGAAIGAGAGAGGGALTQVLTKGGAIKVPAETVLTFQLDKPVKIVKAQ
ncbi:MAG: hypothetical protein ACJ72H_17920 [Candidatus Sulfotelmatobacter sp.]